MRIQSRIELIDRRKMEKWQAAGATDIYTRAVAKARQILETHQPLPLPEKVAAEIRAIITDTEEELGIGVGEVGENK